VRLVAKRSGDPTSVSCRPGLVSDLPSPMKTGLGATYELILLTDLLIADLDDHGHGRTEPPSATPASRPHAWHGTATRRREAVLSDNGVREVFQWSASQLLWPLSEMLLSPRVPWAALPLTDPRAGTPLLLIEATDIAAGLPASLACRVAGQPGVRGIPRASPPRPACPRHARAVGIVNDEIIAGQRENVPAMYPLRSSPPRASSNFLVALVRRLKRVRAPHANRGRGRPKTGIRLGPGVLNPC
jgi:hypothetical protein